MTKPRSDKRFEKWAQREIAKTGGQREYRCGPVRMVIEQVDHEGRLVGGWSLYTPDHRQGKEPVMYGQPASYVRRFFDMHCMAQRARGR